VPMVVLEPQEKIRGLILAESYRFSAPE